jgi:hypothetical protein
MVRLTDFSSTFYILFIHWFDLVVAPNAPSHDPGHILCELTAIDSKYEAQD